MGRLTQAQRRDLVLACTYKPGWEIIYGFSARGDAVSDEWVQVSATTTCSVTGQPVSWKSGKTRLSEFMCRQEVVAAVYGTIERAELHEVREFFRYRGASIFNPHLDPDALAEVAKRKENFNVRDNAMDTA